MNAETLIRILLELDQQCESPRPSPWGKAAQLVKTLASHAEGSLQNDCSFGDYELVDMSSIFHPVSGVRSQPLLNEIDAVSVSTESVQSSFPVQDCSSVDKLDKPAREPLVIPIKLDMSELDLQLTELEIKMARVSLPKVEVDIDTIQANAKLHFLDGAIENIREKLREMAK